LYILEKLYWLVLDLHRNQQVFHQCKADIDTNNA